MMIRDKGYTLYMRVCTAIMIVGVPLFIWMIICRYT
jgi:hypothetical protein